MWLGAPTHSEREKEENNFWKKSQNLTAQRLNKGEKMENYLKTSALQLADDLHYIVSLQPYKVTCIKNPSDCCQQQMVCLDTKVLCL